jgi:hypothetical protein
VPVTENKVFGQALITTDCDGDRESGLQAAGGGDHRLCDHLPALVAFHEGLQVAVAVAQAEADPYAQGLAALIYPDELSRDDKLKKMLFGLKYGRHRAHCTCRRAFHVRSRPGNEVSY